MTPEEKALLAAIPADGQPVSVRDLPASVRDLPAIEALETRGLLKVVRNRRIIGRRLYEGQPVTVALIVRPLGCQCCGGACDPTGLCEGA